MKMAHFQPTTMEELATARTSPPVILPGMFYEELQILAAPGGAGKTSLCLHIMCCLAAGYSVLLGKPVNPVKVAMVSGEESRELLIGRLRLVMDELDMTMDQRKRALENIYFHDVRGESSSMSRPVGEEEWPAFVNSLIEQIGVSGARLVWFDPISHFLEESDNQNRGAAEMVKAARLLISECGCGVVLVGHTGKSATALTRVDPYSLRGGSALPDGARLVHTLQVIDAPDMPDIYTPELGDVCLKLTTSKISYGESPGTIYLARQRGFHFRSYAEPLQPSPDEAYQALSAQILRRLESLPPVNKTDFIKGQFEDMGVPRKKLDQTVAKMISEGILKSRHGKPLEPA